MKIKTVPINSQDWKDRRGTCPLELGRYLLTSDGTRIHTNSNLPAYKIWTSEDTPGKKHVSDISDENSDYINLKGPLEVYIGDDNIMYTRQSICSETGKILNLPNGKYQSISYVGYQDSFSFGEQTEIQTNFLSFQDFYALDRIERENMIFEFGSTIHNFFVSFGLDRDFRDNNGEIITNLYSLITNEIVKPDIRKICTGKGSYPQYQKYLVLFFIEKFFSKNPEKIQSLFFQSEGVEDFQKEIVSLCKNNSFYGTRVTNSMIASVIFYMYQSFFTESVDKLLEKYKGKNSY